MGWKWFLCVSWFLTSWNSPTPAVILGHHLIITKSGEHWSGKQLCTDKNFTVTKKISAFFFPQKGIMVSRREQKLNECQQHMKLNRMCKSKNVDQNYTTVPKSSRTALEPFFRCSVWRHLKCIMWMIIFQGYVFLPSACEVNQLPPSIKHFTFHRRAAQFAKRLARGYEQLCETQCSKAATVLLLAHPGSREGWGETTFWVCLHQKWCISHLCESLTFS